MSLMILTKLLKLMKRCQVSALLLLCVAAPSCADTWTGFQNGGKLALSKGANLPLEWTIDGVAWEIPLAGYGQSSPVIADGLIYVTSTSGGMKENLHIEAFDLGSGQQLWRHDAQNSSPEENTNYVSRAAPSPVCDGRGVIAFFEGGNLIALRRDGTPRWQRDLVADLGPIRARHGLGSSLEQSDRHVFVWVERQDQLWNRGTPARLAADQPAMSGPVLYAVAVAGDELILRRGDRIYKIAPSSTKLRRDAAR